LIGGSNCAELQYIDIAGLFADKYKDLYSCVGFEENDMMLLRNKIDRLLTISPSVNDCLVCTMDVCNGVSYLKYNKSDGFMGLSSDYLINACDELFVHISCLFSGLTIHGAVSDDMTVSMLVPIPKGKNTCCTDSPNYPAIALSSVCVDQLIIPQCCIGVLLYGNSC